MNGSEPVRDKFERFTSADVRDLVAEYPLAWVVAEGRSQGSLLPLLGEFDADGRLVTLLGHMGRRNPLHARLTVAPRATLLFTGPQGYVSPAQAERRNWGPTWNYTQLLVSTEVSFLPDETSQSLTELVRAMEGDRWTHAELGARYEGMARAIIAFRASVLTLSGRFKLGQDEDDVAFEAICRNHPDAALVRWMRRFRDRRDETDATGLS